MKILMRASVRSGKRDAKGTMEVYSMGKEYDLPKAEASRLISEQRAIEAQDKKEK